MPRHARESQQTEVTPLAPGAALATALAVFALLFLVYLATLLPTVVDQDSGELVSACHVLGIAHPTGYPLWVLMGRAFDFLPVGGTSAYRVGLLSAACAAAAGALVTALALRIVGWALPALLAGVAFGLWFPSWSQAVRAEVYGLTGLLFALSLAAFWRWGQDRLAPRLYWLALACGFVAMHHRTAMLAALPPLVVGLALTRPRRTGIYAWAGLAFVMPFLFYAYLPIRAAARTPVNWTNPVTWDRFWDHALASQYQGYALSHNLGQMAHEAARLAPEVLAPAVGWSVLLAVVGLPLIVWGGVWWVRREPWVAGPLAVGAGVLAFWVLQWGETADLKVFLQPLGAVLALYGAVGLACLGRRFSSSVAQWGTVALVGVVICGTLLRVNWERSDLSDLWQHRDRWVAMLSQLEPNAVFVSDNDVPSFATMYLQSVEEMRQDVTLVRVVPLRTNWYLDLIEDAQVREAVRQAWEETPVALREAGPRDPPEMQWDRTAHFAYRLAQRLRGSRPVYVLHGPWPFVRTLAAQGQWELPGPPYFVGLSEDLVALRERPPRLTREQMDGPALAGFPEGLELVAFEWDRTEVETGEVVEFRAEWRLSGPISNPLQFGIGLAPETVSPDFYKRTLSRKGHFVQAFPLLCGSRDLGPSPEGTVYEQRGSLIVPTNTPPGACRVVVGLGPVYQGQYEGWAEVGTIRVEARPKPRNGP